MKRTPEERTDDAVIAPSPYSVLQMVTLEFVPEGLSTLNDTLVMLEEAWWYYIDVFRLIFPELPTLEFNEFIKQATCCVPYLQSAYLQLSTSLSLDHILNDFNLYKAKIPCYGAIIMDEKLEYVLLVRGFRTNRWGLPKGKMKLQEEPRKCAVREVEEEIGVNIDEYLTGQYVEVKVGKKHIQYYFAPNVPITMVFHPNTRMEIQKIAWLEISMIKKGVLEKDPDFTFINLTLLKAILGFIGKDDLPSALPPQSAAPTSKKSSNNTFSYNYYFALYHNAFSKQRMNSLPPL